MLLNCIYCYLSCIATYFHVGPWQIIKLDSLIINKELVLIITNPVLFFTWFLKSNLLFANRMLIIRCLRSILLLNDFSVCIDTPWSREKSINSMTV